MSFQVPVALEATPGCCSQGNRTVGENTAHLSPCPRACQESDQLKQTNRGLGGWARPLLLGRRELGHPSPWPSIPYPTRTIPPLGNPPPIKAPTWKQPPPTFSLCPISLRLQLLYQLSALKDFHNSAIGTDISVKCI